MVRVILIAAVSADGFISKGTGVPWDLPEDRLHFRTLTAGQWLLLGRRTFEEMTGWFRDHRPLVMTHRALPSPWEKAGVSDIDEAVSCVEAGGGDELWVCGGAVAYEAAIDHADELILTEVKANLGEGVAFPAFDKSDWQEAKREVSGGVTEPSYDWVWYSRIRK